MDDTEKVVERVKKLLALSQNNPNEMEAASALSKAQELLEAYNLEMSDIHTVAKAKRSDRKRDGGLYKWQRNIWHGVAKMNFCYYVSIRGLTAGSVYEHRVIGSQANVLTTELMAQYLQDTVERLAQKWAYANGHKSVFVRDAIAFREGCADRICGKLWDRRNQVLEEERARVREQAAQDAARNYADPGTKGLTLVEIISTEEDFNTDYLNGWELGTTAKRRHEHEVEMKAWRAEMEKKAEEYRQWAKAHPKEAAALEARRLAEELERQKREAKRRASNPRYKALTAEQKRSQLPSYNEGYQAGQNVGIDRQATDNTKKEMLK